MSGANFLNCNGNSTNSGSTPPQSGGGCGSGFNPLFNVVLPDVGIPQVTITIPDFTGITIEAILKALELLGINPCAFIDALLGGVAAFAQELNDALNAAISASAQLPQQIVSEINKEAQAGLDDMFAGVDDLMSVFADPCGGLTGAVNETKIELDALDSDFRNGISSPPP